MLAKEKIEDELNVQKMLKKVRISNDLWKNVLQKDQFKLMKFQKTGVVDLDASDEEISSTINSNSVSLDESSLEDVPSIQPKQNYDETHYQG